MLQPKKKPVYKATKDSSNYFLEKAILRYEDSKNKKPSGEVTNYEDKKALNKINENRERQKLKGKPGYDGNGYPLRKISPLQNAKNFVKK
jgi:hypothetical protein